LEIELIIEMTVFNFITYTVKPAGSVALPPELCPPCVALPELINFMEFFYQKIFEKILFLPEPVRGVLLLAEPWAVGPVISWTDCVNKFVPI
jgi:hypothetical protein